MVSVSMWFNSIMVTIIIALAGDDFSTVLGYTTFTAWIFHTSSFICLIILRFKSGFKSQDRPFKVPILVAIIASLGGLILIFAPIITEPKVEYLYAIGIIIGGVLLYLPFQWRKPKRILRKVTLVLQYFFRVAPEEKK